MARKPYSFEKRSRELSRQKKRQDKLARKQEARRRKSEAGLPTGEVDPDIAGIVPGPQPLPEQWDSTEGISPEEGESTVNPDDPPTTI